MITSSDLMTAIAAILVGAVALGWALHWLWVRISGVPVDTQARIDDLAAQLLAAETARDEAEAARTQGEARIKAREAELSQEMADLRAGMEIRLEGREAELDRALTEAREEAQTAWEGLSNARRRIGELERELEDLKRGG